MSSRKSSDPFPRRDEPLSTPKNLRFLVIDDNPDGRFLVSKTLLRRFPGAVLTECQTADAAFHVLARELVSLVVCHRTFEFDAVSLTRELRERNKAVPIVMMSGIDRRDAALAAGANAFLTYDEWLMVGNHVADLLLIGPKRAKVAAESAALLPP